MQADADVLCGIPLGPRYGRVPCVTDGIDQLMHRVSRGERDAVGELFRLYAADLQRRVILPRCLDADIADEALAETFRTVLARIDTYVPHPAGPFPWLARIAISKTMDAHRARARTARAKAGFARLVHPLLAEVPSADAASLRRDEARQNEAVRQTLDQMRPRYRRAIELRFFDELPRDRCAVEMELTIGTFDVLLLRSLRAFRAAFEERVQLENRS